MPQSHRNWIDRRRAPQTAARKLLGGISPGPLKCVHSGNLRDQRTSIRVIASGGSHLRSRRRGAPHDLEAGVQAPDRSIRC